MVPSHRKQIVITIVVSLFAVISSIAGLNALARRAETSPDKKPVETAKASSSMTKVAPAAAFASYVVTSLADGVATPGNCPGANCRLRDAIAAANANPGADTITFDPILSGTITLTNGELTINGPTTIIGHPAKVIGISGNNVTQIFYVNADPLGNSQSVNISDLVMTQGNGVSAFSNLLGSNSGGAIGIRYGNLTLTNCTITNSKGAAGGAVFNLYDNLTVTDCTFTNNTGSDGQGGGAGGAIYSSGTKLTVSTSTFSLNSTPNGGGAIRVVAGEAVFNQCTFTANSACGGGAFDTGSNIPVKVYNSTISGNSATCFGGGIRTQNLAAPVILTSCIVANNTCAVPTSGPDISSYDPTSTFTSGGNNIIGTTTGALITTLSSDQVGTLAAPLDPKLGVLGSYGGNAQTMPPLPGSPAIDKGSNPQSFALDQRGFSRVVNGVTDVGAAEVGGFSVIKSLNDINGGSLLPGDIIEYTILVSNQDPTFATGIVLTDAIPAGTTFVTGSVTVNSVAFVGANPATGIGLANGGVNQVSAVIFRVTVNPNTYGQTIKNTASVSYKQFGPATATSNDTTIKVADCTTVTVGNDPASVNTLVGDTATFTASASGTPTPTVQWEVSTDGGATYNPVPGGVNPTLNVPSVSLTMNGNKYRAVYSNQCSTATSKAATLYVSNFANKFADPLVCIAGGDLVTGTATFTNNGPNQATAAYAVSNLNPSLTGIPGSGVAVDPATNAVLGNIVVAANSVTWNGTLNPGQTVNITYKATLAATVQPGQTVCVTVTPTWNGVQDPPMQVCMNANCPNGAPVRVSDQKPGSVLVFPYYTSGNGSDTRVTLTNTSNLQVTAQNPNYTFVHLMFIDGATCQQADQYVCLTPNASLTIRTSEYDPGATGWILAVAVDANGIPIKNNVLIGNAFVSDGAYQDNYGAETFAANNLPLAVVAGGSATLFFDGFSYDAAPKAFSIEIQSPVDVTGQKLVTVGLRGTVGSVMAGAAQVGTGLIINGKESPASSFVGLLTGSCQATGPISLTSPRVSLGMAKLIPSGQSGTVTLTTGPAVGILMTPKASKFGGIRTLHKTALTTTTITIPVFVPSC